ncbi:MAG: DUF92 domain-containing protein [Gemmatimonadales bacterium]|nr:DUF92 domain-containing protein [Gemmatimonadales bacterium]
MMAGLGWRMRALTGAGAWAAWAVGTTILISTGWQGGGVLAVFFVASTAVSRVLPPKVNAQDAKGDRRDAWQVLANGSVAAGGALFGLAEPALGMWLLTVSLAASASDTWATAVGTWSGKTPRDLRTGLSVAPGTSGGVTVPGTIGAIGGATVVATSGAVVAESLGLLLAGTLLGLLGMAVDSLLGGAAQGRFYCPECERPTERSVHRCGAPAILKKGWRWFSNDLVNFCAIAVAAFTGWAVWQWWP